MSIDPETTITASRSLFLTDLHRRLGANMGRYRGAPAAADYGDQGAESEALHSACGLIDRPWTSGLEMLGEDRTRFLGGYITSDVKSLEPGAGAYGFITSVKGRILADPVVLALDDRLWLELPAGKAQEISQHLSKYVIADRVEIRPLDDVSPRRGANDVSPRRGANGLLAFSLIGPRSAEALGAASGTSGGPLPETAGRHRTAKVAGIGVRLVREPTFEAHGRKIPAWMLWVPAGDAQACFELLTESGAGGLVPVGYRAFDSLRVEAGRPLYGLDFGGENFPQETGLEEQTVSYTKGCYLGQEVVARIHYRGGVNRHLRGLVFEGDGADPVGRAVLAGGREAGTVTSAATLADGVRIGLAILHKRAEPGAAVEIVEAGTARVVELPFRR